MAISRMNAHSGIQMQVLILSSLEGEGIEEFSIRVADTWKIGKQGSDQGLILVVAIQDRQVRLEVGRGLEGDIPDAFAGQVIDTVLVPAFREQNYYEGLAQALSILSQKAMGEVSPLSAPTVKSQQKDSVLPRLLLLFLLVLFFLGPRLRRRRGGSLDTLLALLLVSNGGRSGGFGRWVGGGLGGSWRGGWSGGGGGFAGGGASGRW
jgi:uncharacterized protein